MTSWTEIGEKWNRAQQMGWQAVQAAIEVGEDLQEMKLKTPRGEFLRRSGDCGFTMQRANELMRLALHRDLIEAQKPESMNRALALLPKVPTKTSEKQIQAHEEELDKYRSFAKESAKKQAEIMTRKQIKIELEKLQNQANEAVLEELRAVKKQLERDRDAFKKEKDRIFQLKDEADEQRQRFHDLLNKRFNGFDAKAGMKILRQAVHPDRQTISPRLQEKAMDVIAQIERILGV